MATVSPPLTRTQIKSTLDVLPRIRWAHVPTPLEDLTRLSEKLGGPRILMKRDDATGLAYGGNKARHFEFEMAHVRERGFDTVININHYHSNQARMAAAACVKAGMRYILISTGEVERPMQGNLLLAKLMGAEIHRIPESNDARAYARSLAAAVEKERGKPYILNEDRFPQIMGMLAFVEAGLELAEQLEAAGVNRAHIWGLTGRSIAGLKLLAKNTGLHWTATACKYSPSSDEHVREMMIAKTVEAAARLNLPLALEDGDIDTLSQYQGPAYGVPTDGVFEAIHLVARTEAVILDPNYTGKAMWGLIDQIRNGRFTANDTVVFLHSGGLPQLFAFADELAAWEG